MSLPSRPCSWLTSSRMRTSSSSRSCSRPLWLVCCTWVAMAKPSPMASSAAKALARVARGRAIRSSIPQRGGRSAHARNRCRRIEATLEKIRTPEDDDDAGRELGPHAELVTQEDDEGRDHDVGQERHDEDLVVEDPVQHGPHRTEHRVERGDDGDRQVGLQARAGRPGPTASPRTTPPTRPSRGITVMAPRWSGWGRCGCMRCGGRVRARGRTGGGRGRPGHRSAYADRQGGRSREGERVDVVNGNTDAVVVLRARA